MPRCSVFDRPRTLHKIVGMAPGNAVAPPVTPPAKPAAISASNRDRIVCKDELIDAIWQGRIVSEATLSSRISAARRALGDSGGDQSLIRTLHKRGFRFVGEVEDDSPAPAAVAIEKGPPPQGAADDAAKLVPIGAQPP